MPLIAVTYTYSPATTEGRDTHRAAHRAWLADLLDRWLAPLRTLDPDGDPRRELAAYIEQRLRF